MKNFTLAFFSLAICCLFFSCIKETVPKGVPGGTAKTTADTSKNSTGTTSLPVVPIDSLLLGGYWNIVNDTLTTGFWGLWAGRPPVGTNYIGKPGDIYDFASYGRLYMNENAKKDTAAYRISINQVQLRYAYYGLNNMLDSAYNSGYTVTKLTAHALTLTSFAVSPETTYDRTINFKR